MMIRLPLRLHMSVFGCLAAFLTSCSAPPKVMTPVTTAQNSNIGDKTMSGVVIAARAVQLESSQTPIHSSLDGVLAALHQPIALPSSVSATEYIIQRSNDTTASIVTRASNTSSDNAAPTVDFSTGDRVEIIDGADAGLVHGN